jgi:GAF domain-containing protein
MTAPSSPDSESFQELFSNASAVDAETLNAIVKVHWAIATGEADMDRAMNLIAVHARSVASAAGTAIGLLRENQLAYRAGTGSGVAYVGQHVMATLCVPKHNAASGEILRVENAQTDKRIEASICREFGARSLLILPIYHDGKMAGVLDVLFDEPHVFQHRELVTYRLMAALIGEAMNYAERPEQKKALAADLSTMRQSIRLTGPQGEEALNHGAFVAPSATTNRAIGQAWGTLIARAGKLLAVKPSAWASTRIKRAWYESRWETAGLMAGVLVIACGIGFRDRRPASPSISWPQGSNALEQQPSFVPAKRVFASSASKRQTALGLEPAHGSTSRTMPQWLRDKNIRVRYISDDVTVRYFTPKSPLERVRDTNSHLRYISDDVTVRYFTPKTGVAPRNPAENPAHPVAR